MTKFYLFIFLTYSFIINGQSKCDNANSYIGNAYSHVKKSYEANNIHHLKEYAYRSLESLNLAKNLLGSCNCKKSLELAEKSIDLLVQVDDAETYEDGRFFVKRARDLNKENLIEIDKCAYNQYQPEGTAIVSTTLADSQLSELEQQQLQLKQQQEALKLKAEQLKEQMAKQKNQELAIKKQQISQSFKSRIIESTKTYNETLKIYCNNHIPIVFDGIPIDLNSKSVSEIKLHYLNEMKSLTKIYTDALNTCK